MTKICKCGNEFEVVNFSWQCADCKKAALARVAAAFKAERVAIEKCDECGATENLTVHFGMNEQTGKYSFHYCASCNGKHEVERAAKLEISNREQEIRNYIARTDN